MNTNFFFLNIKLFITLHPLILTISCVHFSRRTSSSTTSCADLCSARVSRTSRRPNRNRSPAFLSADWLVSFTTHALTYAIISRWVSFVVCLHTNNQVLNPIRSVQYNSNNNKLLLLFIIQFEYRVKLHSAI